MSTDLHHLVQVTEKEVFARLEELERAVYVPIVSGEATQWLDAVAQAVKQVEETVCGFYRTAHPELLRQIAEQDPEQAPRVQALEQEDEDICAAVHAVVELAEKLQATSESIEPDERRMAGAAQELSDRSIAQVQRIRKHETVISTWFTEALLRDRGPVD